jgi:hypothetical protein
MKHTILIIMLAFGITNLQAQDTQSKAIKTPSKWTLRADIFIPKSIAPFANSSVNGFHYPQDFGFSAGAEKALRNRKNTRMYHYGLVGFYNQAYFERVTTLATGIGFYRKIYKPLGTNFEIDGAYNRAVSSHLASKLEGGSWVSFVDKSTVTNRFVFTIGGNFEFSFANLKKAKLPLVITLGYNASLLTPYDKKAKLPFNLYHQPRLGIKWKL